MKKRTNNIGSALVVVLISTLVLVILGVGFIVMSKILGGGREMQNAIDSGALNAAKTALISPGATSLSWANSSSPEYQFIGFSPNNNLTAPGPNPDYYLGNINRLWGQAMLVSINEQAMTLEGSDASGTGATDAKTVITTAQAINDRVAKALQPQGGVNDGSGLPNPTLLTAFQTNSNNNTLKMISTQSSDSITADSAQIGWQDASGPANIQVNLSNIFNGIVTAGSPEATALQTFQGTLSASTLAASTPYVQGYTDISLNVPSGAVLPPIYFVPLAPKAKPHMLAGAQFNTSAPALKATATPVNNSFYTKGTMRDDKANTKLDFAAIALAEPVDDAYQMSIPHGFIRIKNTKGFQLMSVLNAAISNPGYMTNNRGLNAAEYANDQILMARSNFQGPNVNGGDAFSQNMGTPYLGLVDGNGAPIKNSNGDPIFGDGPAVAALMGNPNATPPIAAANPMPTDPLCGGALTTPLPSTSSTVQSCADLTPTNMGAADLSIAISGTGTVVSTTTGGNSALSSAIATVLAGQINLDGTNPWGSTAHPHLWSIDPAHVMQVWNITTPGEANGVPTGFETTGTVADPYAWMYTGMQLMPDTDPGAQSPAIPPSTQLAPPGPNNHCSRPGDPSNNPITFGKAGTLWDYLQDRTSGGYGSGLQNNATNTPNPQVALIDRLAQRIQEIYPQFQFKAGQDETDTNAAYPFSPSNSSAISTLLSSATIDMAQDAYIYMDDRTTPPALTMAVAYDSNPTQQVNTASNGSTTMPTWLQSQISATPTADGVAVAGKTIFYGYDRRITTEPASTSDSTFYVENVPGDWGYVEPYTNAQNPAEGALMVDVYLDSRFVFQPCTGYQGQLGVLQLQQFIHHQCPALSAIPNGGSTYPVAPGVTATNVVASGSNNFSASNTPEVCSCVTFPTNSTPCTGGTCTPQTPPAWPDAPNADNPQQGGGLQAAKGVPNCSHTAAC